ncbi:MAG: hypothetical protein KDE31_21940, partial [Caldilineaceae bacterium]|nr:hypothetical protein [Caldilineaceae bacterium]
MGACGVSQQQPLEQLEQRFSGGCGGSFLSPGETAPPELSPGYGLATEVNERKRGLFLAESNVHIGRANNNRSGPKVRPRAGAHLLHAVKTGLLMDD